MTLLPQLLLSTANIILGMAMFIVIASIRCLELLLQLKFANAVWQANVIKVVVVCYK
jgi:hypothetical protein